jgi:tetratricopeptide (TPR) repeat protein
MENTMRTLISLLAASAIALGAQQKASESRSGPLPPGVEAISLLGEQLTAPPITLEKSLERRKLLDEARAMPDSADRAYWIGRRLAALNRFQESIAAFSEGLAKHPDDARLYRQRGHRYVTTRKFDLAIADLERAAKLIEGKPDEIEPDLQPNPKGGPVNTLRSSIWYHLGLAYYLTRDFENAVRCGREGMKVADNPDRISGTTYWLYLALRKSGKHDEAKKLLEPIKADWNLVESGSYLKNLLVFRGDKTADETLAAARADADAVVFPTVAYGIATWLRLNGEKEKADAIRKEILTNANWHAFGFICSEAEAASKQN